MHPFWKFPEFDFTDANQPPNVSVDRILKTRISVLKVSNKFIVLTTYESVSKAKSASNRPGSSVIKYRKIIKN